KLLVPLKLVIGHWRVHIATPQPRESRRRPRHPAGQQNTLVGFEQIVELFVAPTVREKLCPFRGPDKFTLHSKDRPRNAGLAREHSLRSFANDPRGDDARDATIDRIDDAQSVSGWIAGNATNRIG